MKLKAFSLLELTVVLGFVGLLAALSITGLNAFRQSMQLDQATSDFISAIRLAENMARNSVASSVVSQNPLLSQVDGYAIFLDDDGGFSLRSCQEQVNFTGPQFNCTTVEEGKAANLNFGVKVENTNCGSNPSSCKCEGLMIERLSGDFFSLDGEVAEPDNTGTCDYRLTHSGFTASQRHVQVDLVQNNIQL